MPGPIQSGPTPPPILNRIADVEPRTNSATVESPEQQNARNFEDNHLNAHGGVHERKLDAPNRLGSIVDPIYQDPNLDKRLI
jgi:hypothetical protein